jgi:hypothetical protein
MTLVLAGTLLALALVDSLSIGTLLIPVFFLLAPGRLRVGRILVYLATIAAFYFAVGVIVTVGAGAVFDDLQAIATTPQAYTVQLVLGVGLLILSFWIGRKRPEGEVERPGRLARWRERAMGENGTGASLIALALGAGLLELATMLPYLGAIGLITGSELTPTERMLALAAYCAVMIAPALVLLVLRLIAGRHLQPTLERFGAWMQRNAAENTAWIVGIVGFLLARDAASVLGLFEFIDRLN